MHKYRSDIDGLRALAIIPVVIFHANLTGLPGGFVGVDVFFVISGFLITATLKSDLDAGTYSIARFYERRIRRIMPALAFLLLAATLCGALIHLPDDFADLGSSLWATCLFVSNIFFWQSSGNYFGARSEFQPLLHTWSLSVEEQFYIIFPLLLLVLARSRRQLLFPAIAVSLLLSFAISVYTVTNMPVAGFYLLPGRAWELLAGSLLAIGTISVPPKRIRAELEAGLGCLCIVLPMLFYSGRTPFPGLAAMPPVVGTILILHSGAGLHPTLVARALSLRPVRFVGLISYSLYLWHWPIIVFLRYYLIEPDLSAKLVAVLASFIMAIISWRFVERPFRRPHAVFTKGPLFAATAAVLLVGALTGVVIAQDGMRWRVPANIVRLADKRTHQGPWRSCGRVFTRRATIDQLCVHGAAGVKPDFLVVGDSHADAVAASVFESGAASGHAGYQITDTGYRPLFGYVKIGEEEKYVYLNKLVTQLLDSDPSIRQVILPLYWHQATYVDRYLSTEGSRLDGVTAMRAGLKRLIARYPEKRFLLVMPSAHSLAFGGNAAARSAWFHREEFEPLVPRSTFDSEVASYADAVRALATIPRVRLINVSDYLCDASNCRGRLENGTLAYTDDNHLSYGAAQLMRPAFRAFIEGNDQVS